MKHCCCNNNSHYFFQIASQGLRSEISKYQKEILLYFKYEYVIHCCPAAICGFINGEDTVRRYCFKGYANLLTASYVPFSV